MRLITGDECGLLKEVVPKRKSSRSSSLAGAGASPSPSNSDADIHRIPEAGEETMRRRRGVVGLAWIRPGECGSDERSFASLRMDGSVQLWHRRSRTTSDGHPSPTKKYRLVSEYNVFSPGNKQCGSVLSRPLGLSSLTGGTTKACLCTSDTSGRVTILGTDSDSHLLSVVRQFDVFDLSNIDSSQKDRVRQQEQSQYGVASAMGVNRRHKWVALGGKDRETVVWDLEASKQIWKAKNLPPDSRTLLQPLVWPTSILFMEGADSSIGDTGNSGNIMVVGTAYQQIRVYDVRVAGNRVVQQQQRPPQRRPILCTAEGGLVQHRVTTLCELDPFRVAAGDAAGFVYSIDLRKDVRNPKSIIADSTTLKDDSSGPAAARFVGPTGSVRQLVRHETLPLVAAVGLDRMLRIYDTNTRKQKHCFYLKQRLNAVLVDWEGDDELDDDAIESKNYGSDGGLDDVVEDYVDSENEEETEESNGGDDVEDGLRDPDAKGSDEGNENESSSYSGDSDSDHYSGSEDEQPVPRKKARR